MFYKILLIILGIYFLACLFMYYAQRSFLYYPNINNYTNSESIEYDIETIFIKSSNSSLRSWLNTNGNSEFIILFFHGNAGDLENRAYKANAFKKMGYNFLFISYRGFSGNDGKPTENNIYEDAQSSYNWLIKNGYKESEIILYGESLGTAVAIEIAKNNSPKGLILESPFTSMVDMGNKKFPFLPIRIILKDKFDNQSKISSISCPILYLHGLSDMLVPKYMSDELIANTASKVSSYFPENDDHMMDFSNELLNEIDYFINSL